jgi:polysaccharide pyruvyl transferase WcaK-like protein
MLDLLKDALPEADLCCVCDNPALISRNHAIATVPISWSRHLRGLAQRVDRLFLKLPGKLVDLVQTLRYIRRTDVMIVPGTGILDDFGERPYGMPFDIFRWCLAARLVGARIAFVSIGAGPIDNGLSRWLMKAAARLAHYRSYRDELSRAFLEGIGLDTSRDTVHPDIVFRMRVPPAPAREPASRCGFTVGVGVMSYYGWYGFAKGGEEIFATYIGRLARFVTHLLDSGHDIRILTGELADWTAVEALEKEVAAARPDLTSGRIVAEPVGSLREVMEQISRTDVVVATRFHNVVCALKLAKPTISLGYSKKNDVLMDEMGLGDYCQHVERIDVDMLVRQFERLVERRAEHAEAIGSRTRVFGERLGEQEKILLALSNPAG